MSARKPAGALFNAAQTCSLCYGPSGAPRSPSAGPQPLEDQLPRRRKAARCCTGQLLHRRRRRRLFAAQGAFITLRPFSPPTPPPIRSRFDYQCVKRCMDKLPDGGWQPVRSTGCCACAACTRSAAPAPHAPRPSSPAPAGVRGGPAWQGGHPGAQPVRVEGVRTRLQGGLLLVSRGQRAS